MYLKIAMNGAEALRRVLDVRVEEADSAAREIVSHIR